VENETMISFEEFARHLETALVTVEPRLEVGLAAVGEHTKVMAAEYIGHELPEWKPLSEATLKGFRHPYGFWIKGKEELGYTGHDSATDPLLRTGADRDSIAVAVEGLTQVVGSPLKIFLYQEMGTHNAVTGNIPPRPSISLAALRSLPFAADVFGEIAVSLLTPGLKALPKK
jgi:hypothetical protein